MKYTSKQYAKALWELLETKSPAESRVILGLFIKFLRKRKEMKKMDFIVQELKRIYLTKNNLLMAEATSPYSLSGLSIRRIKKFISSFSKLKIDSIILEQKTDKNLIGGFQLKINDRLIDASVKNMLLKLKRQIEI